MTASDLLGDELAAWGKALLITTRGRLTGRDLTVAVGFVDRGGGRLDIAAGAPDADWALNLRAEPRCRVAYEGRSDDALGRELEGSERAAAIRDLILRYGTPAERLGLGPAFALEIARRSGDRPG